MDKVNIGESTLKDFGNVINEAADILNKGKVAFDNSIPDKTLQVLPYTGQVGTITPSNFAKLDEENVFTQPNNFPQINTGSVHSDLGLYASCSEELNLSLNTGDPSDVRVISMQNTDGIQLTSSGTSHNTNITLSSIDTSIARGDRSISFGGPDANNIIISHTPTINNLTEWDYMSDYEVPVKKNIVESVLNKVAKVDDNNTFLYNQTFDGICTFNAYTDLSNAAITDLTVTSSCDLGMDVKLFNLHLNHRRDGKDLKILGVNEGIELNLGDTATLTMNARMISELKRLLGIS